MIRPTIFSVRAGKKKRRVAMLEKGMLLPVEKLLSLEQERRHPGGIVPIDSATGI